MGRRAASQAVEAHMSRCVEGGGRKEEGGGGERAGGRRWEGNRPRAPHPPTPHTCAATYAAPAAITPVRKPHARAWVSREEASDMGARALVFFILCFQKK